MGATNLEKDFSIHGSNLSQTKKSERGTAEMTVNRNRKKETVATVGAGYQRSGHSPLGEVIRVKPLLDSRTKTQDFVVWPGDNLGKSVDNPGERMVVFPCHGSFLSHAPVDKFGDVAYFSSAQRHIWDFVCG
jgi:hypothetical protein